jgi:hypothetical protein
MIRDTSPDPFTAGEPAESFVHSTRTRGDVRDSRQRPDAGEIDQPSLMFPDRRRSRRVESPLTEDGPESADIEPVSSDRSATIQPPRAQKEMSSPASSIESGEAHADTLEKQPEAKAKSTQLSPVQEISAPFTTQRLQEDKTLRLETQPKTVVASTLEPRPTDTVRPQTPPPDEPRLVIGQLRVDVIPTAPSQTREVVRVVTRTVDPNQSRGVRGPISRLRFGLGQM